MAHHSLPHIEGMGADMHDEHNSVFFAAVSTTRMPMIVSDPNQPDNPIVFANPAFIKMTGYPREELIGRNCRFLQGPETDPVEVAKVSQAIKEQREIAVEIINYKKNGSSFWNALFVSPVFDLDGKLIYYFASQLDVTRRRDAEDALYQSRKMEAVGQLTGGIAHDFNNLLTVIQGFSEVLQRKLESGNFDLEKAKRSINAILQATEKGATLTNQLLSFARKQKLEDRVVSLRDLTNKLIPMIEQTVGEAVKVEVVHKGCASNSRIDPVQAEMAIINIAANARDAMDKRGVLTITTESLEIDSQETIFGNVLHGRYICLSITDTGSGMSADTLSKITEPFFTTKPDGKGTGLGMSMVYGFVNQSGGNLKIESKLGEGTTVHMLFKSDEGKAEIAVSKANRFLIGRQGDKETILVVEDKPEVGEIADFVLSEFGYTVIRANDGDDALRILASNDPVQMMFSDISMPGSLNGVQLARIVNERYPSVKVLLTTGFADTSIGITDNNNQAYEILNKPYKQSDLIKKIRLVLDGPNGIS